jgi:hypothetical protein
MRFYSKIQKYKFSNLPQNNQSKRRSTRVDHVSEVSFETGSLDLRRFGKPHLLLLLFYFFIFFIFFLYYFFLLRRAAWPFSFLLWGAHLRPTYFYIYIYILFKFYLFIFLFLFFYFLFSLHFNNIKLASINYLPKFCI